MASTSETGLQLFARLVARPSLVGLEDTLFLQGPNPKDVVELSGGPGCGKTLLLTLFVAKSILPQKWKEVSIGGLKSGVVLLNTDHHLQVFTLISLMETRLRAVCDSFTVTDVEDIVKDSLGRLTIYNISDSHQFQVTLLAVQKVVSNQTDIGLILLDSVCSFYWQDSMTDGIKKMDLYAKNVLKTMQKSLADFKGVIMYTRPSYFQTKSAKAEACSLEPGMGCVNRRIHLKQVVVGENNFCASVETHVGRFEKLYTIDSSGFNWVQ